MKDHGRTRNEGLRNNTDGKRSVLFRVHPWLILVRIDPRLPFGEQLLGDDGGVTRLQSMACRPIMSHGLGGTLQPRKNTK